MQNNRAFEFLGLALEGLQARKVDREHVALYIRLAIPEIQEALERIARYEMTGRELEQSIQGRARLVDAGRAGYPRRAALTVDGGEHHG